MELPTFACLNEATIYHKQSKDKVFHTEYIIQYVTTNLHSGSPCTKLQCMHVPLLTL